MRAYIIRSHARGFTLIEIMIVVGILGLLAALITPAFLRARLNANESVAIQCARTLYTALESYRSQETPPTYPDDLVDLSGALPAYVDSILTSGTRSGYDYSYEKLSDNEYTLNLDPVSVGVTGVRYFYVDESGVMRTNETAQADSGDPALE